MDPAASFVPQKPSSYTPPSDPSKYIRTFAKDVAAITGTAAVPAPETSTSLNTPTPEPIVSQSSDGVSLPDFDPSPVQRDGDVSAKEFPQEELVLGKTDSDGIFENASAAPAQTETSPVITPAPPVPVSMMPAEPILPAESAPAYTPLPTQSNDQESREAILQRLREKVTRDSEPSILSQQEQPPVIVEQPVSPPTQERVDFSSFNIEPSLKMGEGTGGEFTPDSTDTRTAVPSTEQPSPIHTFTSDFADHIDEQKSSTFSVLAAQSDAGQNAPIQNRTKSRLPLMAGIAMLVIGIGAIAGAIIYTRGTSTTTFSPSVPSLITFDESVEVKGSGEQLKGAVANVANGTGVSGNVVVTYLTNTPATSTAGGIPQPGGVLIRALGLSAPDILMRNIQDESTVGVIKASGESRPFLILKVSSYERTFAGMLAWEENIAEDLAAFYPAYPSAPLQQVGTTTATVPAVTLSTSAGTFQDAVVANYNVRVLRDASGRSLILYGYKGKDLLIIARDEAAFTALVNRISTSGD